ncbi:Transposable element P transposase [Armadillidium nasatum]|uniref:Transposable element P transposase n=1 Tax=Armadillidium nasatum TaxID=96803 RepID=A0A5N5TL19_9CRUS|nr:Transposable element P transposase [Armadillidium nasatum]
MEKYGLQFEDSQPMFVCKNCLSKIIVKWKQGNAKSSYSSENVHNTSSYNNNNSNNFIMAKRKFTQEDIESALDVNSSDSEYEDDVEYDVMYDSENDEDYIAACSSSSDEDDEFDAIASTSTRRGRLPSQRMRTSTPSPVSPSAPSTSDSTSASAAPPAVRMQRRRRVRSEEYISSIVDFNVSTLKTRSDFRWHCRPQSTTSTRVSARNIMFDITPGPAQQARTADNPEKSFRLLFEDKIISEIVEWTNQKIQIESQKYSHQSTTISQTSAAEPAPTRDCNKPVMGECTSSCSFISTPEKSIENVSVQCSSPTRNALVECTLTKNAESQYSPQVKDSANQCKILTSSIGVQCEIDTHNTLNKILLRKVVRKKSWHIRYLKQRNKMLKAKIGRKNIKPIKTSGEMFNFCSKNLPIVTTELFKSQLIKEFDAKHKWTEELKNVCLSVYLKSPKAYKVLKQALKLPSVDTLIQFLKTASVTPGFEHQLNDNLKNAVEDLSEFDRCVVLLMDEINLHKNLRFNGEYIVGLEDFGYDKRTSLPASSALCFMVRSMSGNWMQLIGYAFSHGPIKLKNLKFLFEKCLLKLNEIGLKVMCITTNQGNNFASLFKTLGVTKCKPYFHLKISDVNYKYIVIPDVPHLLKSTRNAIFNNSISTPEGTVKWQYIEEAYNLKNNLPYIPKVSEVHVKLPSLGGKMKVKLAAQILSRSVSEALQTMRMEGLSDENSFATEQFCLKINNLFDILNSSPSQKGTTPFHQKLQAGSKGWEYISDIKSWIECWEIFRPRDSQGQCKVTSRFRFVNGWIQAINGVTELLKELKNFNFHYIYTRRLCLDPLENCFGDIRGGGGGWSDDDPTCSQFEARFQRIAVNFLLQIA